MRVLKKAISLLLAALTLCLSGCSGIYSNFREVEELLVLETMGLDRIPGGVRLSLAAGAESSPGTAPVRLEGAGSSVTMAIDQARNSSFEQELFFSNIDSLLIGERAAQSGIDDYMAYVCQAPMLRIDIPVFLVRHGSARDCVIRCGDEQSSISDILQGISDSLSKRGDSKVFSAAQVINNTLRHGSALVCALEMLPASQSATGGGRGNAQTNNAPPQQSEQQLSQQLEASESAQGEGQNTGGGEGGAQQDQSQGDSADGQTQDTAPSQSRQGSEEGQASVESVPGEEKFSAAPAGLAVLKNFKLCAYIEPEDVLGVGFLLNEAGVSDLVLNDGQGQMVTVQINEGGSRIYPIWAENGSLMRLDIAAHASATVLETQGGDLNDPEYADDLTARLEDSISDRISSVLELSSQLGADFLGLGSRVEQRDAKSYRILNKSFASLLPGLEMRISVSARLSHANDIKEAWK